jgi:hypothetical protein
MNFRCLEHGEHKFSLDPPKEKSLPWAWKGEIHCPSCGSANLEEVVLFAAPSRDLENMRKENRERTQAAMAMAGRAKAESELTDPTIRLDDKHGTHGRFSGNIQVKKSVVDKLTEKAESGQIDLTPPSE